MVAITLENVRKAFGSFAPLESVSLTVEDKEFAVLLGPSGCGKTTLLRIIAGLEKETDGVLRLGERRINGVPPRLRNIAMVFQSYAVFPHLSVFENIAFGLRAKKLPNAEVEQKVKLAAAMMHIEQQLSKYSAQLSGGQRQRVAVARALAMEPEVLLMDEPLSNLDALLRMEMRAELKGLLAEYKTTTIYVTHDQVEAMSLADRVAVMHGGHIVQYDKPLTVYRNPANVFCGGFIGNPPMNFLKAVRGVNGYQVSGAEFAGPMDAPEELVFGIRPEDLSVTSDRGPRVLSGIVAVVEPLGPHQQLTVNVDGHALRATVPADLPVESSDSVHLKPSPERIRWFHPETEQAIR